MKTKLFTILVLTFTFNIVFAQSGWFFQTSGTSIYLTSVQFINNNTGWTVGGYAGTIILKTTNGGTNWTSQTSGIGNDLNSVHFIDNNTGWVVGDVGTILNTTNGGTNWTSQVSGTSGNLTVSSIHR